MEQHLKRYLDKRVDGYEFCMLPECVAIYIFCGNENINFASIEYELQTFYNVDAQVFFDYVRYQQFILTTQRWNSM
jgi:hypothetical protein